MASKKDENGFTGNVGEWAEPFVLMHLLANNNLYYADSDCNKIEHSSVVVDSIYRTETDGTELAFVVVKSVSLDDEDGSVLILKNGESVEMIPKRVFREHAHALFENLRDNKEGNDSTDGEFLRHVGLQSLKSPSTAKEDLIAKVYDGFVGAMLARRYSIKALIGANPSLSNASGKAYFEYELIGFNKEKCAEVMSITPENERSWVVERTKRVVELCTAPPIPTVPSKVFDRNLRKCYWRTLEAVGYGLLYGQTIRGKRLPDSILKIKEVNPGGWEGDEVEDYNFGIRKYLWAIVFGMDPGTPWKGPDVVDGYLIATKDEEVLAYQVSRQKDFEDYLLKHSSFDIPSTKRNEKVGVVREENGKWYYSLQCVVKFQPKSWGGDKSFFDE